MEPNNYISKEEITMKGFYYNEEKERTNNDLDNYDEYRGQWDSDTDDELYAYVDTEYGRLTIATSWTGKDWG